MEQKQRHKTEGRLFILFWFLIVLFTLLTVATYTWFALSKTPEVSDMAIYINANQGLEIAWQTDSEEWGQHLDFADIKQEIAPLRPITYSFERDTFFAAAYGLDGRISGITDELNDKRNSNKNNSDGYYLKVDFYARTGEPVKVSLKTAETTSDEHDGLGTFLIGQPIWDPEELLHANGGNGAECAMRVGMRITKTDKDGAVLGDSVFILYEPNCDKHLDGSGDIIPTKSIDGSDDLVPEAVIIRQTASTWTETDPVQHGVVKYDLGKFDKDPFLFTLDPTEYAHIELYVWLEGQDTDCTNSIGQSAQILANVQFYAVTKDQSGMQPID